MGKRSSNPSNVLVISDTHAPFHHENSLDFLRDTYKKYKCTKVVHIGDELDFHALSFHARESDAEGPKQEYLQGMKFMRKIYKLFPKVKACISNHTARPYRIANDAGIPKLFLRGYRDWMQAPKGWEWANDYVIDNTVYLHGMGYSGKNGALNAASDNHANTVIGHLHAFAGIQWTANSLHKIFGMNVGCLIDKHSYAMRYGRDFRHKPIIGCGIVFKGKDAKFEPMQLGSKIRRVS
jgi:hypothetical protein